MTVDILEIDPLHGDRILCSLEDRDGEAVFAGGDYGAAQMILEMGERDPHHQGEFIHASHGRRFLEALPYIYNGSHMRAKIRS